MQAERQEQTKPIKVLVVDDSPFRRETLQSILNGANGIEVIDTASNGQEAIAKTLSLHPDVITMDVQMPIMNGFEAIDHIMRRQPTPIIVISGIEVDTIVKALSMGAMDFVSIQQDFSDVMEELVEKIRIASRVQPIRRMAITPPWKSEIDQEYTRKIIAIGVSTGGPAALTQLFQTLPSNLPASLIVVQHITTGFIQGFVQHLNSQCPYEITLAQQGQQVTPGTIIFAPDDQDLYVNPNRCIELRKENHEEGHHITSIDIMMSSVAQVYGSGSIGVLMTGMGQDGVKGMAAIKQAGGITIAQNEQTSTVYGMNRLAIESGYIDYVLPLHEIGLQIENLFNPSVIAHGEFKVEGMD